MKRLRKVRKTSTFSVTVREFATLFRLAWSLLSWPVTAFAHITHSFFAQHPLGRSKHAHDVLLAVAGIILIVGSTILEQYLAHNFAIHAGIEVAKASGACPLWDVCNRMIQNFRAVA